MKLNRSNPLFTSVLRSGLATLIIVSGLPLAAQTISVNFGDPGAVVTDPAKTAGPIPIAGNFWNNPTGPNGSDFALRDSAGNIVSSVTWSSANIWTSTAPAPTATSENALLYKQYLDDGAGGPTINIKSPYLLTDVYVIPGTDETAPPVTMSAMSVNGLFYKGDGAGGTIRASGVGDSWVIPAPWTTADTLVESDNYLKIPAQTSVVVKSFTDSPGRGSIAGVQLKNAYTGTIKYWDVNGATAGAGNTGDGDLNGTWGTNAYWSPSEEGTAATTAWTPGSAAVFSAGSDLQGYNDITLNGTQIADAVWVRHGAIILIGGTLDMQNRLGLLRGDDLGLEIDSIVKATNLSTDGMVTLNNVANTITGIANINGTTYLGANHTFPQLTGGGNLYFGSNVVTVGNAIDSTFGGNFEGTGDLKKVGTGKLTLGSLSGAFDGTANVTAGTLDLAAAGAIFWDITGPGKLVKSGPGQLTIRGDVTTTGTISLEQGTLQLGDVSDDGSIPANATLSLNGMLRFRHDTLADVISGPVSLGENGQVIQHAGTTGTLTISSNITSQATDGFGSAVNGSVGANGGEIIFASGSNSAFKTLPLANGIATIQTGATIRTRYLNIGNGTNTSGVVNQTGGTVTIESGPADTGAYGIRIGHWGGAGRQYNISGGTLDATATITNQGDARYLAAGWDGEGDITIGGGAGAATVKVAGLMLDRDRADAGNSSSTATILPKGVLEIGTLGIRGQGTNDGLILSGGLVRGTGTSTWNTSIAATTATTSIIDVAANVTVNHSRPITGDGALSKTGPGTLLVTSGMSTYTGVLTVSGGALGVDGSFLSPVTIASGGTIRTGNTASGILDTLTLANGSSSSFRVGGEIPDNIYINQFDGLSVSGTHSIRVVPTNALTTGEQIPLINYGGTIQGAGYAGLTLAPFPNPHYNLSLVNSPGSVDLKVNSVTPNTWKGTPGTTWNLTDANWNSGAPSKFYQADIVIFGDIDPTESVVVDTLGGTAPIAPAGISFTNTTATTYTISGDAISGPGGIVKTGNGKVIFTNDNTFTGQTDIEAGTLQIGNGGTTGAVRGNINVGADSLLVYNRSDEFTVGGAGQLISGAGSMEFNGTGTMILAGQNSIAGGLTANSGTVRLVGGGWYVNPSQGTGMLTINPGATVVNVNSHSYGGGYAPNVNMTINGGTFQLEGGTYVGDVWMIGGTIENFPGSDAQFQTRGGGGTNLIIEPSNTQSQFSAPYFTGEGASTITVNDPDTDFLMSGPIRGGQNIIKNGVGTLVSSGANTDSIGIIIQGGTVKFTGDNSARTGGIGVENGTTFTTTSVSPAKIGTGYLGLMDGTFVYQGTGAETTNRFLWIDRGTGTINIANSSATLTFNPTGGRVNKAVIKEGPGRLRMQGPITGEASVTVNAGRLDLDGANTYTGDTTVNTGGTIVMSLANLDDASTIRINGTGKMNLDHGATDTVGSLIINGTPLASGKTYGGADSMADIIDSVHFTGSGKLLVTGESNDYDDWIGQFPSITNPADKLPGADPDGDGLTNQQEYAFGLNPASGSSVNPIVTGLNKGNGTFTYQRRKGTGLTYKVHTSTTLASWAIDATATEGPIVSVGENEQVTVTLTTPPTAPQFFIRVSAE